MNYLIIVYLFFCGIGVLRAQESTTENFDCIKEDVLEILRLIPREKVTEIAEQHLKTDNGLKAAVNYMKSDEWVENVESLRKKPEWIRFKSFITSMGFPVDTLIFCMESFLQNVTFLQVPDGTPKNLTSFIIDVEKAIPLTEIIMKFHEKQVANKKFDQILEKLKAPETKTIVEDVVHLPEIKKIFTELKDMGLNLEDFFAIVYFFSGWGEFKL